MDSSIVAIIAARGGSKRLPRKNLYPIFGKPMIAWAIEACTRSVLINDVYVSTEDEEIAAVSVAYDATHIPRPASLSRDEVPKMEVIRHAEQWIRETEGKSIEVIVSVQANSPEIKTDDIDRAIKMLVDKNLYEVLSVSPDGIQNAAIRAISTECLYNTFLSSHIGVIETNSIDVHIKEDVESIVNRYSTLSGFTRAIIGSGMNAR